MNSIRNQGVVSQEPRPVSEGDIVIKQCHLFTDVASNERTRKKPLNYPVVRAVAQVISVG